MTITSLFGALAQAFTHRHVDVAGAAAKLARLRTGLETAEAVLAALPTSRLQAEALTALHDAAIAAGQAIAVAHTLEAAGSAATG